MEKTLLCDHPRTAMLPDGTEVRLVVPIERTNHRALYTTADGRAFSHVRVKDKTSGESRWEFHQLSLSPSNLPCSKANGMQFTVTGLDAASKYAYHLAVADAQNNEIIAYSGEFATNGYEGEVNPGGNPESIDEVPSDQVQSTKVLRNGQIYIIRGDKTYTLQGQEVK